MVGVIYEAQTEERVAASRVARKSAAGGCPEGALQLILPAAPPACPSDSVTAHLGAQQARDRPQVPGQ